MRMFTEVPDLIAAFPSSFAQGLGLHRLLLSAVSICLSCVAESVLDAHAGSMSPLGGKRL